MQHPVTIKIQPIDKAFMMSIRISIAGHDFGYDGLMMENLDLNEIQGVASNIIESVMAPKPVWFSPPRSVSTLSFGPTPAGAE